MFTIALPLALACIMFSLGLSLTPADFGFALSGELAGVAMLLRLPPPQVSCVAIESGFQNGTVGIAVGALLAGAGLTQSHGDGALLDGPPPPRCESQSGAADSTSGELHGLIAAPS